MDTGSAIREYEYQRLVFGNTASPFLSQLVIREHAIGNSEIYPKASNSVLNSMYVDDLLDSVNSVAEAVKLRHDITSLLQKGGFQIRKWLSNESQVLRDIPECDRLSTYTFLDGGLPSIKTLGIIWNANTDNFTFNVETPPNTILTKRFVVSKTASLFDPLNLLAPFTIRAKIGIQSSWVKGVDWDQELPADLIDPWKKWFKELPELQTIQVQRCLSDKSGESEIVTDRSLHTFVDASEKAYAAACYLRCEYDNHYVSVNLIASKTRVSPLKSISIPKLELCGAVLGLRLSQTVNRTLNLKNCYFWSDSKNVLFWIHGESRSYKPFVSHRVGEIHESSSPEDWHYVPSKLNCSDLATRGLSVIELSTSQLWWHGPDFLKSKITDWPVNEKFTPDQALDEVRNNAVSTFLTTVVDLGRLNPDRFSKWLRLVRVLAWVKRFVHNCRNKKKNCNLFLSSVEIDESENFWFKYAQCAVFHAELCAIGKNSCVPANSKLNGLNPWLDDKSVLRVGGRLEKANQLSYSARHPIILPRKHPVTQLLVRHYHETLNHDCGVSYVLSEIRLKFWILRARECVKSLKCFECARRKSKPAQQLMAPLPRNRLESLRAFSRVGLDFGGPYSTKQGRGRIRTKRYLCLFTCLSTRAVHLEMAWSLDTDSFLSALERFISRRSKPIEIVSDNGTNFVSANRELRTLINDLNKTKLGDQMANKGIKWTFNPPVAPHFGGVFESLIKSAKRAIRAILGEADISDEELLTAITSVEGLLNSRPLCYVSDSVDDDPVLTPSHFLCGQLGGALAPDISELRYDPRKRWRRVQDLLGQFWRRWLREFMPCLNSRSKWNYPSKNIEVGDVVIVIDPQSPRGKWPLGRIVKTFPGSDGLVRVVEVKVGNSIFKRPIHKLCPLEA